MEANSVKNIIVVADELVKSFEKIRDRINEVKDDPQLVNLGINEIIKEPSTGKSCKNYMKRLHEIKTKTSVNKSEDLLNILAASRKGISIKNLQEKAEKG